MKITYNKLVRDNIPEIIKADNSEPMIRILNDEEFIVELFKKIQEEYEELVQAKGNRTEMEKEIGDIYEVIEAIIDYYNLDKEAIIKLKQERKIKRGGFNKRIFLESSNN
jgi:predicted house-cleaning noncanonical NTP pyrophosphatase (MazG superfamily)